MLDSRSAIVVNVFLYLALPQSRRWLVERHLDGLLPVGDDHRTQGTVLRTHLKQIQLATNAKGTRSDYLIVINGPETMKLQRLDVHIGYVCHFIVSLVTHDVVNEVQVNGRPAVGGAAIRGRGRGWRAHRVGRRTSVERGSLKPGRKEPVKLALSTNV